ncbi:MAG: hypothetical protein FWF44_02080 [Defluviitaleaceae bacterium]|nr:hypothetical protein [Defluviitaleaceae bacterium]
MAIDNTVQKALIGVAMVVLTAEDGTRYSFSTSTKANANIVIEAGKKIELVIKGVLKAQKKFDSAIKGVDVEFDDNMFLPEVVALLQGGEITRDLDGNFMAYTPPVAGSAPNLSKFDVEIYTEETDTSGDIVGYVKLSLPNGKGEPVELTFDDSKFYAAKYTISTAPAPGQPPYIIEAVASLPEM